MESGKQNKKLLNKGVTFADIILSESASLIPGGSLVYGLGKLSIEYGREYLANRNEARLKEFHETLFCLDCGDEVYIESLLKKKFDIDDYYALLNSCVQDIEAEKTIIYADLMKSFLGNDISKNEKRFYIILTKEFSYSEINLLKEVYIKSEYDLMTAGGISEQLKSTLKARKGLEDIAIKKFIANGLISDDRENITDFGRIYIKSLFSDLSLKPESIGRNEFSGKNIALFLYNMDAGNIKFATKIQNKLWSSGIKSNILALKRSKVSLAIMSYQCAFLLLDDVEYNEKHFDIEALSQYSESRPIVAVHINENGHDLSKIKLIDQFDINDKTCPKEIDNFLLSVNEIC